MPYRPWKFKDGDTDRIAGLMIPDRNKDDRSPFVRYARSAAMWAEWVREDVVVLDPEIQTPTMDVHGLPFQYGLLPLELMSPLVSVPPSAKDHYQRLLEATQLYSEPIVVARRGDDRFVVVGNHELYAAAVAYQAELARAGKRRSSDVCLVALCDESLVSNIKASELSFASDRSLADIRTDLVAQGFLSVPDFADSPRTDDPMAITILLGDETFLRRLESGNQWTQHLVSAFGLRSLDFGSNDMVFSVKVDQTKVTIVSPQMSLNVLNSGSEFPYGSYEANIRPLPGANMWSLRDFRAE
jgi:hypothetical protein